MGKDKLKRFRELEQLEKVFQPAFEEVYKKNHPLKGRWKHEVFRNDNPIVLELGCGAGEYTVGLARIYPGKNFLGVDIKGARIWKGVTIALREGLENVVFLRTRIDFINSFFDRDEVDEIWITFPDPQEKKRRRKKRLTSDIFLNYYRQFFKDGGYVNLKTDNFGLYSYTLELAKFNKLEIDWHTDDLYQSGREDETVSIQTYYEARFRAEGMKINFIRFRLPSGREIKELPYDVE
ncbi:MAG: tRNA (guanosine(46)-N7)-methyltransferase TrmB [Bacteroidetes bacterium]|nr:tRNA (guanosine(46)-N7)-methyltransferase TrmB [Bacteroidota bacterium]